MNTYERTEGHWQQKEFWGGEQVRLKVLWTAGIFIAAVVVGAACSSAEPPASAPAPAAAQMDLPDTDGEAMLEYLRGENYQETWLL